MDKETLLDRISRGRTDLVFELMKLPDWQSVLHEGEVKPLQWFVYYNDTTALKAVLNAGGDLSSIDLNSELGNASFFGHWKVADFLISQGADVNWSIPDTGETPLHSAALQSGTPVLSLCLETSRRERCGCERTNDPRKRNGRVHARRSHERRNSSSPRRGVRRRSDDPIPAR